VPYTQFIDIVFVAVLCSCASGLALIRPLKAWPAARWIDHPDERMRWLYRLCLLVACVLLPLSIVWIAAGLIARFFGEAIDPNRLIPILQAAILFVPLPFAYLLYRRLLAHVRNRVAKVAH
jgi:hypothetical protein